MIQLLELTNSCLGCGPGLEGLQRIDQVHFPEAAYRLPSALSILTHHTVAAQITAHSHHFTVRVPG